MNADETPNFAAFIAKRHVEKAKKGGFWAILSSMDLEQTMQFILETQAQLTASAQKHDEQIAKNSEQIAKHDEQIAKNDAHIAAVTDLVGRLAQAEIRLVERMGEVEASQQRLFERMDRFIQGLEGDGHKPR